MHRAPDADLEVAALAARLRLAGREPCDGPRQAIGPLDRSGPRADSDRPTRRTTCRPPEPSISTRRGGRLGRRRRPRPEVADLRRWKHRPLRTPTTVDANDFSVAVSSSGGPDSELRTFLRREPTGPRRAGARQVEPAGPIGSAVAPRGADHVCRPRHTGGLRRRSGLRPGRGPPTNSDVRLYNRRREPLNAKMPASAAATAAARARSAKPPIAAGDGPEASGASSGARSCASTGFASASSLIASNSFIHVSTGKCPVAGSSFASMFREALAGAVEADRCGVLRAVERDRELRVRESLPRGEAEDLLLLRAQLAQRGEDFGELATLRLRRRGKLTQPQAQRQQPPRRAPLVREHARGDRVEPGELQLLRRSVREAAPRDGERVATTSSASARSLQRRSAYASTCRL